MGTTLLARLALHGAPRSTDYLNFVAAQQVSFASHMQNATDGLFIHGYNFATNTQSCCRWGRANGWVMMSHAEIVSALAAVAPNHPLLPAILDIWRRQSAGLAAVQNTTDGRWHQVLDHPETFLETSVTSMTTYSLITGVMGGWLDAATYAPVIEAAWPGIAAQVAADGTVNNICTGTGIGTTVDFYEQRPTDYAGSAPGLGSVFRAARAFAQYAKWRAA
jgi:unsaturated rhamnogalacturonyl hydrolase